MNRLTLDLWVGIFVASGIIALLFLGLKVGNLAAANNSETYLLLARFDNIGGLKVRGAVKAAGVVVGRVADIHLDSERYLAVVTMKINKRYQFPRDTFATINTSGLLGEQYVGLDVGGDPTMLKEGEMVTKTQSAVVLEKLIGQFLFGKAAEAGAAAKK